MARSQFSTVQSSIQQSHGAETRQTHRLQGKASVDHDSFCCCVAQCSLSYGHCLTDERFARRPLRIAPHPISSPPCVLRLLGNVYCRCYASRASGSTQSTGRWFYKCTWHPVGTPHRLHVQGRDHTWTDATAVSLCSSRASRPETQGARLALAV